MNNKKLGIGIGIGAGLIIALAGLGYQIAKKSRRQTDEKIEKIANDIEDIVELVKNDPERLLRDQVEELLKENTWKNERDFLECLNGRISKLTNDFGTLVRSQEDLLKKLEDLGFLEKYEEELEKKYTERKRH